MNRIDQLYMEWPFAETHMLCALLHQKDMLIGQKHIATLMRRMGLEALYRKPRTTHPHPPHPLHKDYLKFPLFSGRQPLW
ncbi:MAG: hypothetical protein NPIRA02_42690 [Nitrospirales bacterium]|nr:MAG: hypothetical protein NPIRA02_42690 [Nitrospirales bacterium]